jgi:hypothetical protein
MPRKGDTGKIEVIHKSDHQILDQTRTPTQPGGKAPALDAHLSAASGSAALAVTTTAKVTETSAPVFYTLGPDSNGIEQNTTVAWELYGPNDGDYTCLRAKGLARPDEMGGHTIVAWELCSEEWSICRRPTGNRLYRIVAHCSDTRGWFSNGCCRPFLNTAFDPGFGIEWPRRCESRRYSRRLPGRRGCGRGGGFCRRRGR